MSDKVKVKVKIVAEHVFDIDRSLYPEGATDEEIVKVEDQNDCVEWITMIYDEHESSIKKEITIVK